MSRIYTKAGDGGETRLAGGQKVDKDSARIEAFGTVDELLAQLGLARAVGMDDIQDKKARACLEERLRRIQNELFNLGASLAVLPENQRSDTPRLSLAGVERLEREIDEMNATLARLRSFVLPGGGTVAATLHVARAVCRRAERRVIHLGRAEVLPEQAIRYLNRLSDWLFVASRWIARAQGQAEPLWEPKST